LAIRLTQPGIAKLAAKLGSDLAILFGWRFWPLATGRGEQFISFTLVQDSLYLVLLADRNLMISHTLGIPSIPLSLVILIFKILPVYNRARIIAFQVPMSTSNFK
jgi:hypothetical protein